MSEKGLEGHRQKKSSKSIVELIDGRNCLKGPNGVDHEVGSVTSNVVSWGKTNEILCRDGH